MTSEEGSSWFDPNPVYVGIGVVELANPVAVLEGDAIGSVDDRGLLHLTVAIEKMNGAAVDFSTLNDLIMREGRVPEGDGSRSVRYPANPCSDVRVRCSSGLLSLVEPPPSYTVVTEGLDLRISLKFVLRTADFSAEDSRPPAFWVQPITNLVTRYAPRDGDTKSHPLLFADAEHGSYTLFERSGELGFIAPLPDHRDREQDLEEGRLRRAITAVAVGTLDDALRQSGEVAWIRLRFALELLDLCSLSPVGVPWTEIRTADGGLLRRLHHGAQISPYLPGSPPIDEFWARGTGSLISAALADEVVRRPFFRSSLAKIVRSGEQDAIIEHRLLDVFIALDTLCDAYETKRQPRLSKLLSKPLYKQVHDIVDQAVRGLGELEPSATDQGVADILHGVKNRVGAVPFRTELGFAQALLRLMNRFGLADRQVIESQFPTDIGQGKQSTSPIEAWTSLISRYRSIVVHNGAFEHIALERPDHPGKVLTHLRDLLIRLVLTSVGYEGGYFPEMFVGEPPRDAHWVTADTSLEDLGYFVGVKRPWPRRPPEKRAD